MVVSKYGFFDLTNISENIRLDPSRIASCIVTGISFVAAGTIFVHKDVIIGLTTSVGLWATVGIGMAIGAGLYVIGICATALVLLVQVGHFVLKRFMRNHTFSFEHIAIKVDEIKCSGAILLLQERLRENGLDVCSMNMQQEDSEYVLISITVKCPYGFQPPVLVEQISKQDGIVSVDWKRAELVEV